MAGFSINTEVSLWKKIDRFAFEAIDKILETVYDQTDKEDEEKLIKKIRSLVKQVFLLLQNRANIKLDLTHPDFIEFQNNLLSWIGPKNAENIQVNITEKFKEKIPFDQKILKRLIRHAPKDIFERAPEDIKSGALNYFILITQ
jgi:hypothetical protein